jgi:hypothetical protein
MSRCLTRRTETTNRFTKIGDAMKPRFFLHAGLLAALMLFLGCAFAARADDVQVTAAVADDETDVGQPVDYTITVSGATDANVPENINVDGLTITYSGPSSQTSVSFGTGFGSGSHIQRSVIETYSVVANRAGNFVIPAQQVEVNGNTYTTQQVSLKVGGGGGTASGGGGATDDQGTQDDSGGKLFWAEIVLPKTAAYIGEAIPFEVRLYVDARVRAALEETPEITADGCTVEKTTKGEQSQVTRNGRDYDMVTFKSAVTPAKTGTLKLGPATVLAQAELPMRRPRRPQQGGPFDDPFFQNPFFDDAFRMMSPPQQITIRGEPVEITALPLPTAGMPASFAGAVGNYSMTTSIKPSMVEAGDPITVTAKISGQGNFDKVTAPQVTDPDGWRIYPPSGKFEQDDDIGISGAKTFEMAAIPQTKKAASPAMEWSYFDPIKEQYVTLTEKGWPITIEGQFQTNTAPVMAATQQAAAPTPDQSKPDIMYIRADSSGWGGSFQPLYQNRIFWAAQGAPLLALLAFVGFEAARKRAADLEARRVAGLRREKEIALAAMQRRDIPESELYQAAARVLRLEAAIQTGRAPDTLDGSEVSNVRALDPAMAERVRRLFDRQAEAVYAGTSGGRSAASAETRVEALETVKGYENARRAA